jgi:hypothetical protein
MDDAAVSQNYYEVLQVHPAAPLELITGAYWWLINRQQAARSADYATDMSLHQLTKAYQTLADPTLRRSHDVSLGLPPAAPFPALPQRLREPPRRRRSLISRRAPDPEPEDVSVDYYEVLRVHPQAEPQILALARAVVRDNYLRQVRFGEASAGLLELLEEAYAALSDPDGRPKGDAAEEGHGNRRMQPRGQTALGAVERASPGRQSTTAPERGKPALTRFREAAREVVEAIAARVSARPVGAVLDEEAAVIERLARAWGTAPAEAPAAPDSVTAADTATAAGSPPAAGSVTAAGSPTAAGSSVASAPARLVVTGGPQTGSEFALNGHPVTVGAARQCDVVLPGTAARQAWIWSRDGHFVILNLSAEPEMLIGGRPLVQATLKDGDLLTIGHHRIRFDLSRSASRPS